MKRSALFAVIFACMVSVTQASTPPVNERLAGTYSWSVPGSVWTLLLSVSGEYSLTTQGSFEKSANPIESGSWELEGFTLLLESKQPEVSSGGYRRLYVLQKKKSWQMMLVSAVRSESYIGQPFGGDTLFDYVFLRTSDTGTDKKQEANQSSQPTPLKRRV